MSFKTRAIALNVVVDLCVSVDHIAEGLGVAVRSDSAFPVVRTTVEIGDRNDADKIGRDLIDDTVRKPVHKASPRVGRHSRPGIRKLDDPNDGGVNLFSELKTETGLAFLVIPPP